MTAGIQPLSAWGRAATSRWVDQFGADKVSKDTLAVATGENFAVHDRIQTSFNLALGSGMASIGLTIPTIAVASIWLPGPLHLGLNGTDIVLLTNYFAQKFRARFKKRISSISQASLDRLQQYSWPGNVRELEHIIERAVLLAEGEVLTIDLPLGEGSPGASVSAQSGQPFKLVTLEEMERDYIEQVVKRTGGMIAGRGGAAEVLGLPASTLRSRMKKLGVK